MVKSIAVRRAPARAYNPQRPVSDLLRAHIRNLEAVTGRSAAAAPRRTPKNEAQASAYIAELTRQIPNLYSTTEPTPPAASGAAPAAALARLALKRRRRKTSTSPRRSAAAAAKRAPARKASRRKARRKTGQRRARTSARNPRRS